MIENGLKSHFFILYNLPHALNVLMNENLYNKLKQIDIESLVLTLFIAAAVIDIVSNDELKKAYLYSNGKENIRKKYILASCLVIVVFSYFSYINYQKLKNIQHGTKEYYYAHIRLVGSVFALIGEVLILCYFINTPEYDN